MKYINKRLKERTKYWAKDCYLTNVELRICLTKQGIEFNTAYEYLSPVKRMTLTYDFYNLKLPAKNDLKCRKLSYANNIREEITPFFEDRYWRNALFVAFQNAEHELLGRYFICFVSLGFSKGLMRISFLPSGLVRKHLNYTYRQNSLYKDEMNREKLIHNF